MTTRIPSLGFLLFDAARLMRKRFDRLSVGSGLTRAQFQLLMKVSKSEGINQAALADLLDMEPISVCRTIDRMEAGGLLTRRPDPKDRRAHLIFMTDAAQPALDKMQAIAADIYDEVMQDFTDADRSTLIALLTRLHANAAALPAAGHAPTPMAPARRKTKA